MKSYSAATLAALQSRTGFRARTLVWITGRNRTTGALEGMGLWNGREDLTFTIAGQARLYYGAGAIVAADPIVATTGLTVQMHQIVASGVAPAVVMAVRGYDPRLAPVEMHRALFSAETGALLDEPHRVFKGWCDTIGSAQDPVGGKYQITLQVASAARALTRKLATKKSDAALRQRNPNDGFRKYAARAISKPYWWGTNGPAQTASGTATSSAGSRGPSTVRTRDNAP